ncbi:hypothetical protein V4Q73_02115 [Mycoplasmoides genitalium]
MSGELPEVNTHRVFSLFKCWVIIDLTPTLMLEKVGRGVEEVEVVVVVVVVEEEEEEAEVEEEEEEEGEGELASPSPYYLLFDQ